MRVRKHQRRPKRRDGRGGERGKLTRLKPTKKKYKSKTFSNRAPRGALELPCAEVPRRCAADGAVCENAADPRYQCVRGLPRATSSLISLMHVQSGSIPISTLARIDFGDIAFLIGQSFPLYIADKSLESSQVAVVWASNARMVANWWQPQVWPETEMCQDVP